MLGFGASSDHKDNSDTRKAFWYKNKMTQNPLNPQSIVVLGAGHAGGALVGQLRQFGYTGPITIIGDESFHPYQRPPLSKTWLSGDAGLGQVLLKPEEWYAANNVDLRLGERATFIDRKRKVVSVTSGPDLPYDILVIATGASPRKLGVSGENGKNIFALRTIADAEALKAAISPDAHVALIGAGYIGLEVAASAIKAGAKATVIEREGRSVARVACPSIAAFLEAYHRAKGVEFKFDTGVDSFAGEGAVEAVNLNDGQTVPCDIAVVGIGVTPNQDIADAAGLECKNGVVVDEDAMTSDPSIFAIGDVSFRPIPRYDTHFRLESVPNVLEQARRVAAILTGKQTAPADVPWFWSDQYDLKIQIAGLAIDCDTEISRGDPNSNSFAVFHLKGKVIRAVEAINAPPEFMVGRKLIGAAQEIDPARLADSSIPMKEVV